MKAKFKTQLVRQVDHSATGAALRDRRIYKRLSLRSLATELGISAAYLSDLELGRRNWTEERFAEAVSAIEQLAAKNK